MESPSNENEVSAQVKQAIRAEVVSQSAKGVVAGVVFLILIAAAGWSFYLLPKIKKMVGGVPTGAVVAFDDRDGCPDGWRAFDDAKGRFVIGAGKGEGLTLRAFGEPGGKEEYTLTIEQVPAHTHKYTDYSQNNGGSCVSPGQCKVRFSDNPKTTEPTGGVSGMAKPYSSMPPFIALRFCKKV